MGFWSRLFGTAREHDKNLLESLLNLQAERIKADSELSKMEHEVRLKTKELELANLEKVGEEKRRDAEARAELREKRKEWAKKGREELAKKRLAAKGAGMPAPGAVLGCTVCADPGSVNLTAAEIAWHNGGHPGAMQ